MRPRRGFRRPLPGRRMRPIRPFRPFWRPQPVPPPVYGPRRRFWPGCGCLTLVTALGFAILAVSLFVWLF